LSLIFQQGLQYKINIVEFKFSERYLTVVRRTRRQALRTGAAAIGATVIAAAVPGLADAQVTHATIPATSGSILAVSVFGGDGPTTNVDTGLTYGGVPVSPTYVSITPYGFEYYAKVGFQPHNTDTKIDVDIYPSGTWIGLALYIG
jgi:hypothetical protein